MQKLLHGNRVNASHFAVSLFLRRSTTNSLGQVMRHTCYSLLLLSIVLQVGCESFDAKQESELIRNCFENYKKAILAQDGEAAVALVDNDTLAVNGKFPSGTI